MNHHPSIKTFSLLLLLLLNSFPAFTQEQEQPSFTFTSDSGTEFFAGDDSNPKIIDVLSENRTVILTPQEGHNVASLRIRRGTEESWLYAQEIRFQEQTEAFTLTGEARIERDEDIMIGPKYIIFDPEENVLTVEGYDKENPAKILYTADPKTQLYCEALQCRLIFEQVETSRKLKDVEFITNYQWHVFGSENKPSPDLRRKLSSPK